MDSPSTPSPSFGTDVLELRDWCLATVTAFLCGDAEVQDAVVRDAPEGAIAALAMLCASQIQVLAALEGQDACDAMQEFALRLQRYS